MSAVEYRYTHGNAGKALAEPEDDQGLLPLCNGDVLDQPTFHERYTRCPSGIKAELLGGVVFMAFPVHLRHRRFENLIARWLGRYEDATPGVKSLGAGTVVQGREDEPEPDGSLHIRPEAGGQTREEWDYHVGTPELVIEISNSTVAIDLHAKKDRYRASGVPEYLVVVLTSPEVRWFRLVEGNYELMQPDEQGILHSQVFPGLWLDPTALLGEDTSRLWTVLDAGLATAEHREFVTQLPGVL